MTPLALEMLVWFHTRGAAAGPFPNIEREPQSEIVIWFLRDGIIDTHEGTSPQGTYRTTDKGDAWLWHILETQMPVQVWARPEHVPEYMR